MKNKKVADIITIKDYVNVIEIEDINEKGKFKMIFRCGNDSIELKFDYEEIVAIGCDRDAIKKMMPFFVILNHMLEENYNESEEN